MEEISDDHELMMRTYLHGRMVRIDKPLYLYRVDGNNTWLANTNEIQTTMWRYTTSTSARWPEVGERERPAHDGPVLEKHQAAGYEGVDLRHGPVYGRTSTSGGR